MDEAQVIARTGFSMPEAEPHEVAVSGNRSFRDHLHDKMDPEVAKSFSEPQLMALESILAARSPSRLPVDIRLTVPLFRRRFFVTLLAGEERRSELRLQEERVRHPLWRIAHVCGIVLLLLLFVPAVIGLVHMATFAN